MDYLKNKIPNDKQLLSNIPFEYNEIMKIMNHRISNIIKHCFFI